MTNSQAGVFSPFSPAVFVGGHIGGSADWLFETNPEDMPDANPPPQQSSTSPSSTQTTHSAPLDANAIPASEPPMHREPAPRRKPGRPRLGESPDLDKKRSRNTAAARKYRQKQFDRIKELEDLLADAKKETDDLKLRLARQEAESATLRGLLGMGGSGPRCSREGNTSSAS